MQKQVLTSIGTETESFGTIVKRAQLGDNQALIKIIDFLQPDLEYLACFIKMSKEDSIQEMILAMIEAIRYGDVWFGE
ncbi:hypothetical protein [Brevibacillus marinus]|uniref:hypothetical protein n=1 Tax=Brevibacillus marinus TaxID=2496837 RepID=UPI000F83106D|nr:hypothetical protein [Brevibacillus marinus]